MVESYNQDNSAWKGTQELASPTYCWKQAQLWGETTSLRALSRLVLKTSKMETAQPVWATFFNAWLSLWGKKLFLFFLIWKSLFTVRINTQEFIISKDLFEVQTSLVVSFFFMDRQWYDLSSGQACWSG